MASGLEQQLSVVKKAVRRSLGGVCLSFSGGLGDHLLLTTVARELKQRGTKRVFVLSEHRELFDGNHDVGGVITPGTRVAHAIRRIVGWDHCHSLEYAIHDYVNDVGCPPVEHIVAIMCRRAGISGEIAIRPYMCLSKKEEEAGADYRGYIAVQCSGLSARSPMLNKEWLFDRFAEVAKTLLSSHRVVQIGSADDPRIPATVDLRGRTSMRVLGAILRNCRLFVGLVGFAMHMARAVDCPAVIVYGGREHPTQSGYVCNENIFSPIECAPCWQYSRCENDRECMRRIKVTDVVEAIDRALQSNRCNLMVERVMVGGLNSPLGEEWARVTESA